MQTAERPASTVTHRLPAAELGAAGGALLGLVALAGLFFHAEPGPLAVDQSFRGHLVALTVRTGVPPHAGYEDIVALARTGPFLMLILIFAVWAWSRRDAVGMVTALAGPLAAVFVADHVLKPLVDRRLEHALTFPSGHATAGAAVATMAVVLVYRYAGERLAAVALVPALLAAAGVAVAVVGLHWHYVTDAIAGVMVGCGVVLCVAAAAEGIVAGSKTVARREAASSNAGSGAT